MRYTAEKESQFSLNLEHLMYHKDYFHFFISFYVVPLHLCASLGTSYVNVHVQIKIWDKGITSLLAKITNLDIAFHRKSNKSLWKNTSPICQKWLIRYFKCKLYVGVHKAKGINHTGCNRDRRGRHWFWPWNPNVAVTGRIHFSSAQSIKATAYRHLCPAAFAA